MRKKMSSIELTRENVVKTLNDLMYEVANEGLPYDKDAEELFTKEEFYEFNNDFRMYGTLFGAMFIDKLIKKLDDIALNNGKEN